MTPGARHPWPEGTARLVLEQTDSTMAEARRQQPVLAGPAWILARRQTAGHGRRGRPWAMPAGNFAATLSLPRPGSPAEAALRSFIAALALHDALADWCDPARLSLKWPNDVLLDGGKVAGILLEAAGAAGRVDWLSIGIGVNLVAAPPPEAVEAGALRPVALGRPGAAPTPEAFLDRLAPALDAHERAYRSRGFDPIRRLWLSRAARLGQVITARTGTQTLTGTFETVDADGHLVLLTSQARRAIPAAEVFF